MVAALGGWVTAELGGDDFEFALVFFGEVFNGRTGRGAEGSRVAVEIDEGGLALDVGVGEGLVLVDEEGEGG